jgi:hypothetical protein
MCQYSRRGEGEGGVTQETSVGVSAFQHRGENNARVGEERLQVCHEANDPHAERPLLHQRRRRGVPAAAGRPRASQRQERRAAAAGRGAEARPQQGPHFGEQPRHRGHVRWVLMERAPEKNSQQTRATQA